MIFRNYILLSIGAGLMACSSVSTIHVESNTTAVNKDFVAINAVDSLVSPYQDSLKAEMDIVIARAEKDMVKGRPNGVLNNWATDVTLFSQKERELGAPTMCLLNVGGLRNTINAGEITIGDLYKVMPFDNEVVCVELPIASLQKIGVYLYERGGEPIAGVSLTDDKLTFNEPGLSDFNTFWVVTSDYLMNGGDNMDFFEDRLSEIYTGQLLRDIMIEAAKSQKTLNWNEEKRIK